MYRSHHKSTLIYSSVGHQTATHIVNAHIIHCDTVSTVHDLLDEAERKPIKTINGIDKLPFRTRTVIPSHAHCA